MPKLYPITLYYDTKYDGHNSPDSPARLDAYRSKTFSAPWLRQDYGTTSVRIDCDWEDVRDADYVQIGEQPDALYYTLAGPPIMISDHTAVLNLDIDPLPSLGGVSKLRVIAGWASRAHTGDDTLYANTVPEPWAPTTPYIERSRKLVHSIFEETYTPEVYHICIASANLLQVEQYGAELARASDESEAEGYVVWPSLPLIPTTQATLMSVSSQTAETNHYQIPDAVAYDMDNDAVKRGLTKLRGLGLSGVVQATYSLPKQDAQVTEYNGQLGTIQGYGTRYDPDMPHQYKTVKNKKAIALHNTYHVVALSSGSSETFASSELYDGSASPSWRTVVDPSPTGTVYLQPMRYMGATPEWTEHAVPSLPWLSASFVAMGADGAELALLSASRRVNSTIAASYVAAQDISTQRDQNLLNGVIGSITGFGGAASGGAQAALTGSILDNAPPARMVPYLMMQGQQQALGAGMSLATGLLNAGQTLGNAYFRDQTLQRAAAENTRKTNRAIGEAYWDANVALTQGGPTLEFPVAVNASVYLGNPFLIVQTTLSDNDLQRFDDFLSANGYACDERLVEGMFTSRTNHNYVKATGALLDVDGAPRWLLNELAARIESGLRIWHVTPSATALYDNPIKGV